jgi:hypothetical protein
VKIATRVKIARKPENKPSRGRAVPLQRWKCRSIASKFCAGAKRNEITQRVAINRLTRATRLIGAICAKMKHTWTARTTVDTPLLRLFCCNAKNP